MSTTAKARRSSHTLTVRLVEAWGELAVIEGEWEQLAGNALERSPSSEAWMLLPALRHLAAGENVRILLIYADSGQEDDKRLKLCGVFPLQISNQYKGLPIRIVRLWNHRYSLSPAPLVHCDFAADCLRELLRWVRSEHPGTTLIEFRELRAESQFFRTLTEVLREEDGGHQVADITTRAFFRRRSSAASYLEGALANVHHRKELKRQERRLAEMGQLTYRRVRPDEDIAEWLDAFVRLEMQGWKGQQETAFGSKAEDLMYLKEVVTAAAGRGELMLLGLWLDDKPLALKLNFLCGEGGYTFKIAYDEAYSKYSPGMLLELENIRQAHDQPDLVWLDSLALPNHPMVNRVWLDRTAIVTILIAPGRLLGQLVLGLLPLLGTVKRMFRGKSA